MKILIFAPWAYSTSYYTAKYCNAISKNFEIFLYTPRNFQFDLLNKDINIIDCGFNVSDKFRLIDLLKLPIITMNLLRNIKKIQPDWFHILWLHPMPIIISFFIRKIKIAFTVHDPVLHKGEAGFLRQFIQKRLIKISDINFVHGLKNKKALFENYSVSENDIIDIPHGEFIFWNKDKFNVKQEKIILFLGRIRQYKGVDVLLKAFKQIQDKIPDYKLLIAGQGDISEYIIDIKSIKNIEVFNKYVEHDEIAEIILKSLFAVLPYTNATQSGVIPMVFALGRTCIATNVGAIPESIENYKNGILVQPSNINELAEKILLLASDINLREKLQKNAYESIRKSASFSWEKTSEICSSIYNSVKKH